MAAQILQGSLVLTGGVADVGQVVIENGVIADVAANELRYQPTADYGNAFIMPGLIDVHVHGIAGADVMDGSAVMLGHMARRFAAHGVTGFLPTTLTASVEDTHNAIAAITDYADHPSAEGAAVLGIHLEGPFISRAFKGMQNDSHILPPDDATLLGLLEQGRGHVMRVSLAPELPGAAGLIRLLRDRDVYVSIAHTGASYEQAVAAAGLGASHVTHCFNAMTGLHHRKPGVVGAAMLEPDLFVELIADGIHIHPAAMRILIRMKGRERIMLVTDSLPATDMPDGMYRFGGHDVTVAGGIAQLADGTLASSTLTMEAGVRNLVQQCGAPLQDAVHMASTTPAEAIGLGASKGKMEAGYDADLTVLDREFHAVATWIGGHPVSPATD